MSRKMAALVVGNADYPGSGKLKNPANDAHDITAKLELLGFSVSKLVNGTNKQMDASLKHFKKNLTDKDISLFFFAGHGMQIEGENYLLALDTDTSTELDAKHSSLSLSKVIDTIGNAASSTNIIFLDACRNNPYERAWARSITLRGLAPVYTPKGTMIAYSTSPGQVASDGVRRNGAYTEALLEHIDAPDCSIENMLKRVRNTLSAATRQSQISWEHTSLADEFFFNLSLGIKITQYSQTALNDSLYVPDDSSPASKMIQELKSATWPRQNPAIDSFTVSQASRFSNDNLFIIGRNIYQSACGHSRSAIAYIRNFQARTVGMPTTKQKALLDGMLLEVFFDSKGQLRTLIRDGHFDDLFELQKYPALEKSFEFISECLVSHGDRFHSIPGRKHSVALNILTKKKGINDHAVSSINFGSTNILWLQDAYFADKNGQPVQYESLRRTQFESRLAEEMLVPNHLLVVTYADRKSPPDYVQFPRGWTVRKQKR
jgi:hypothetical protein